MPEILLKEEHYREELIDGVTMMAPAPSESHNNIMANILVIFRNYLRGKHCRAYGDNIDVFLDDNNHFRPDASIICDRSKIKGDGIHGAPDLVAEILSRTTSKNDRGVKMKAYERFGVKEYRIVDPANRSIEVYLNTKDGFILDNIYAEKDPARDFDSEEPLLKLKVSLYDDLIIDVRDVFSDMIY